MSWSWFLSLFNLDYVSHTDFLRMGMTEGTNLKLGASTQALTQIKFDVGWLRVVINMFLTDRIWCEWEKCPRIRALVSLSSVNKIWNYDQLDLTAARKIELAKNHGKDRWTSRQKMCFLTTNLINYCTYHITTRPIRKIYLESSSQFFNFNNILTQITIKTNGKQGNWNFGGHLDWCL